MSPSRRSQGAARWQQGPWEDRHCSCVPSQPWHLLTLTCTQSMRQHMVQGKPPRVAKELLDQPRDFPVSLKTLRQPLLTGADVRRPRRANVHSLCRLRSGTSTCLAPAPAISSSLKKHQIRANKSQPSRRRLGPASPRLQPAFSPAQDTGHLHNSDPPSPEPEPRTSPGQQRVSSGGR